MTPKGRPPSEIREPGSPRDQRQLGVHWIIGAIIIGVGSIAAYGFYWLGQVGTTGEIATATSWAEFMVAVTAGLGIWISLWARAPPSDEGSLAILDWLKATSEGPTLPPPTEVPAVAPDTAPPEDQSTSNVGDDCPSDR
jgi:hypothetical protein